MAIQEPRFDLATSAEQKIYNSFFEKTNALNASPFGTAVNLTELVDCAEKIQFMLTRYNPIFDTWERNWGEIGDLAMARQWEINRLSEVKQRLAQAIVYKKEYYENNWLGKVTKFFLKLFCMWNNGDTAAIVTAEDFLLSRNFPTPLIKQDGLYKETTQFTPTNENFPGPRAPVSGSVFAYQFLDLDWSTFFNYDVPDRLKNNTEAFIEQTQQPRRLELENAPSRAVQARSTASGCRG